MEKVLNNLCPVDSNEAWETYVHHHKNAAEWRNKSFPLFDRLANIFGKDRVNEKGAEVPSEMMEEQGNNEVDASDDNDTSPIEDRSDIAKEVKEMGFSAMDQIKALKVILDKPKTISLFKSLDVDIKKAFIEQLLNENA
ncbi:hypothetical protein L3X38_036600 [Prunus dulcis]|uniref:Uncharacterized protein n=1 Tax=Prunus dulcis TaxID=3755 RepID=A0AAD4V218_PRUDU|nr:hypothetical protein L3X38_036600 [Prunus dulcis]